VICIKQKTTVAYKQNNVETMNSAKFLAFCLTGLLLSSHSRLNEVLRSLQVFHKPFLLPNRNSDSDKTVKKSAHSKRKRYRLVPTLKWKKPDLHAGFGCIHNTAGLTASVNDNTKRRAWCNHCVRPGRVLYVQRVFTSSIHLMPVNSTDEWKSK